MDERERVWERCLCAFCVWLWVVDVGVVDLSKDDVNRKRMEVKVKVK